MPGPPLPRFERDSVLPDAVDVVVIGGGIAGVCTALELLERGVSVALCEKGDIGCEQSSRNWGWVRVSRRDHREIELVLEAQRRWKTMAERVGESVGYVQSGISFVAHDDAEFERQRRWLSHAEPFQVRARLLEGDEFRQRFPEIAFKGVGALLTEDDGRAEPQLATTAIAGACRRLGGHMLTLCAVRGLDMTAGEVSGVVTESGRIACGAVVVAGGAWSSLFCASVGVRLPQLKVLSSALRTAPLSGGPSCALWTKRYSVRQRHDAGYTVATGHYNVAEIVPDSFRYARQFVPALRAEWASLALRVGPHSLREFRTPRKWALDAVTPFEKLRVLDPTPSTRHVQRALSDLAEDCPTFRQAKVEQIWAGMIDVTPDALPVISAVDKVPGLYISTGYSGHGFGIAPGAGRLMADLVTGTVPIVDPHVFRLSRFEDGTPIVLDAGGV